MSPGIEGAKSIVYFSIGLVATGVRLEVEASAKAETKVEAKDEQPPVPYIVCSPKAEEPEAPETPQLKDTPEETPPNDTVPDGTVDFDAEFTQKFLDQAQSVIMQIESLA